jgi:hypothetical protein
MASIKKTMAFDSAPESAEMETGPEPAAPDETPQHETAEGEASIPLDAFGGSPPKMGDTLRVVSVDSENGTVSVMVAGPKKMGGIESKAAMMDEEDQASITA